MTTTQGHNLPEESLQSSLSEQAGPSVPQQQSAPLPQPTSSKRSRASAPPPDYTREWVNGDLSHEVGQKVVWSPNSTNQMDLLNPVDIFENFVDEQFLQDLYNEAAGYAFIKGRHDYIIDTAEMQAFLTILIISGYSCVPRR